MGTQKQKPPVDYGSTSNDGSSTAPLVLPMSPKLPTHMTTYIAGEDAGRLASMAKEFGLAKRREPREGVRERVVEELGELNLHRLKVGDDLCLSVYVRALHLGLHDFYPSRTRRLSRLSFGTSICRHWTKNILTRSNSVFLVHIKMEKILVRVNGEMTRPNKRETN